LIVEKQYGSSEKEGRCSQQGGTERGGAQGSADARPQQTRPQSRSESWAQSARNGSQSRPQSQTRPPLITSATKKPANPPAFFVFKPCSALIAVWLAAGSW